MRFLLTYTVFFFLFAFSAYSVPVRAFQYNPLPSDNLIQNPWFRVDCKFSIAHWQTQPTGLWDRSYKTQNPTDENCGGDWTGTSARFAREGGAEPFFPNVDATLFQIVGPVNPENKTLHFHSLIVAHRVNKYKAEIYGSNSATGPWTSVWAPFSIENCLSKDCVNESPPNGTCNSGNRECLWDEVSQHFLGSLNPLQKIISQGYPYYKIEFLMNYPSPDNTATGDVGGKLARVYFKVSGGAVTNTPTTTPSSTPIPTNSLSPASSISSDRNRINTRILPTPPSESGETFCCPEENPLKTTYLWVAALFGAIILSLILVLIIVKPKTLTSWKTKLRSKLYPDQMKTQPENPPSDTEKK